MKEREHLLQHGSLPSGVELSRPEMIATELLNTWLEYARAVCTNNGYFAVAFTEFPQSVLASLGLPQPPRMIYISSDASLGVFPLADALIINPTEHRNGSAVYTIHPEGCGSIRDKHGESLLMFVDRPLVYISRGFVWKPGEDRAQPQKIELWGEPAAVYDHEMLHTKGQTALSARQVYDPRLRRVWEAFKKTWGTTLDLRAWLNLHEADRVLVPTEKGIYSIVNVFGDEIDIYQPFVPPSEAH